MKPEKELVDDLIELIENKNELTMKASRKCFLFITKETRIS